MRYAPQESEDNSDEVTGAGSKQRVTPQYESLMSHAYLSAK